MPDLASREAAEEFVEDDPFVLKGAIARWHIREWNEGLAGS
ncbi:MAG TPA: YciI family protein [Candidatus Dormibacteraeota bacterium]|nr:YciI family protein [Candidatus Dormibacteraeota bacterium]